MRTTGNVSSLFNSGKQREVFITCRLTSYHLQWQPTYSMSRKESRHPTFFRWCRFRERYVAAAEIPRFKWDILPSQAWRRNECSMVLINRVFAVLKMKNAQFCFTTQESINIHGIHLTTNSMSSTKSCFFEDNKIRLYCQHIHIGNSLNTDYFFEKADKIAYSNECSLHTGRM
jgi:hypothetical protein